MKITRRQLRRLISETLESNTDRPWHQQTFSDDKGTYKVTDISAYAKKYYPDLVSIPIQPWETSPLKHNLEQSEREEGEDIPGHPEFVRRADKTDLSHPLLIVDYPDDGIDPAPGLWIADGVHRLWKARSLGLSHVIAYVMPSSDLQLASKGECK
jgi:hypothetical protein